MDIKNSEYEKYIGLLLEHNEKRREGGRQMLAYVYTFGCQQNEADSERIRGLCASMGYGRAQSADEADLIIVNTCAVREHAENRALSMIGELKHRKAENPDTVIGICGCMVAQRERAEQLKMRYHNVDFTVEPNSVYMIPRLVWQKISDKKYKRSFMWDTDTGEVCEGIPVMRDVAHRAYVSIMYGCNNFCSYCIVPYVRGRERSRKSEDIIAEVNALIDTGCKDITLLGQNVNSYKSDCDFATLLSRITEREGDYIIRFMTSHPKDTPDALIDVIALSHGRIEPHCHLPLQSGSDRILRGMNRKYGTERYLSIVKKLREKIPDIAITTDIIVGYPGESEEDFEKTLDIMRLVRFDMIYSFIYSPRKGTPAAEWEQLSESVKGERMRRLLALQDEIAVEKNQRAVGTTLRVLVDGESSEMGIYSGRTAQNKLVHFSATESDVGKYLDVEIERASAYVLYGKIKNEKRI